MSALDSGHYGAANGALNETTLVGRREADDLFSDDDTGRFCCTGRKLLRDECKHGFKWLRDPRYAPDPEPVEDLATEEACFLPVEIIDQARNDDVPSTADLIPTQNAIEVDIAVGHRLRINGAYDAQSGSHNGPASGLR